MEQEPEAPPANAEDWSDEQWIEWLKATDEDAGVGSSDDAPPVATTTGGRVAHSTGGQLLGNAMVGLASALYGPQDEKPAVVAESGDPDDDQPLDLQLDFDHPEQSQATFKPSWWHRSEVEND